MITYAKSSFTVVLAALLFLGALFWAKGRDPFQRVWFKVKAEGFGKVECVAVLPKMAARPLPVVVYLHGSGGSLMNDGKALRQMAEMGLAAVGLEYNQTNEAAGEAQFAALNHYLQHQKWADTNAIAWVGFSLGAQRTLRFALKHPEIQPKLLIRIAGGWVPELDSWKHSTFNIQRPTLNDTTTPAAMLHLPAVLLLHGEQDSVFPLAEAQRVALVLQTNGVDVELKNFAGLPHDFQPNQAVVFRLVGEYCLTQLRGTNALDHYESILAWQARACPLVWFWLPAVVVAAGVLACRRAGASRPAEMLVEQPRNKATKPFPLNLVSSLLGCLNPFRAAGCAPSTAGRMPAATLRWLAGLLAIWALVETAIHWGTPRLSVNDTTLAIARRFLVQPKQPADFEYLAAQPIWQKEKLKTLLQHVELANYNRELVNWKLEDQIYRKFVLSLAIDPQHDSDMTWRPALWENFYPRIRRENDPLSAAEIVVRFLRERVTVSKQIPGRRGLSAIWQQGITDSAGFERIYVAALRAAGIPAKINAAHLTQIFVNGQWLAAPRPAAESITPDVKH